jgi:hypothetical protein
MAISMTGESAFYHYAAHFTLGDPDEFDLEGLRLLQPCFGVRFSSNRTTASKTRDQPC